MYCMRNHRDIEAEAGTETRTETGSAADSASHVDGTKKKRKSMINSLLSLLSRTEGEGEGEQSALSRGRERGRERDVRDRDRDQHRFIEVTDPSLHHIVSQHHAKAITGEDYLVAETLKREAYRVARAHTRSTGSRTGHREISQVFYQEGDTTTHRSPINPLFYESRARSAKIDTAAVGEGDNRSNSVNRSKSNSDSRGRGRSSGGRSNGDSYTTNDNDNDNSSSVGDQRDGQNPLSAVQDIIVMNNSNSIDSNSNSKCLVNNSNNSSSSDSKCMDSQKCVSDSTVHNNEHDSDLDRWSYRNTDS